MPGCTFGFLTLEEMWSKMLNELTTTLHRQLSRRGPAQ